MNRYLKNSLERDLEDKMVFLGGPRQVGKTTLALGFLERGDETHDAYLNWDDLATRRMLLDGALPANQPLLIFDEIHKYKNWRNLIKGFYDKNKSALRILVTGSARLDHYRRGGDSLQGRYHYYRLHPLSLFEVNPEATKEDLTQLLEYGGFPEAFLKADKRQWKRWQREHRSRVIQEDLLSLEHVKEVSQLELLASVLPDRVGAPLSINNLRQDLSVAFDTADRWIRMLENLYYCFRISPFGLPKLRASTKERKLYMWDWSLCEDPAEKFENLVASNLLKYCHFQEDTTGDAMELQFIRDAAGREIDFVVSRDGKPEFAVECKLGERGLSKNIKYFSERTGIPLFYQVHSGEVDVEFVEVKARILPLTELAKILGI